MRRLIEEGHYTIHEQPGMVSLTEAGELLFHLFFSGQTEFAHTVLNKNSDLILYTVPLLGKQIAIPLHPDLIHAILVEHGGNTHKDTWDASILRDFLGDSLFASFGGQAWERRRKLLRLKFNHHSVKQLEPTIHMAAQEMIHRWIKKSSCNEPIVLNHDMTDLTLQVICTFLFGNTQEEYRGRINTIVEELVRHLSSRYMKLGFPNRNFPTPGNQKFEANLHELMRLFAGMIQERREKYTEAGFPLENADVLDLLTSAREEETNTPLFTDDDISKELLTMLVAGHETTATAATWALYLLSKHPTVLTRLKEEIASRFGHRKDVSLSELKELSYLDAVIKETLRLYPPLWVFTRLNNEPLHLYPDLTIPKDAYIVVSPYVVHRNPQFWENPEAFQPERFLPSSDKKSLLQSFMPFGVGERMCLGKGIAMMELPLILTQIVQQIDLNIPNTIDPALLITLRPERDVLAQVTALSTH